MTKFIAAVIAVLAAQSALAERRENKAFNTVGGRSSVSAPAAPRVITVAQPGGGMSANTPPPAAPAAPAAKADGGQAIVGGGRQAYSRNSSGRGVQRRGKAFSAHGARRADAGNPGAGGTTTAPRYDSGEERPPNYDKPGALVRTTGSRLPQYEKAEDPKTHTVDAGEIVLNNRKAFNVGQAPSIQYGPRDTPPSANPGGSGMGTSAAANGPTSSSPNGGKGGGLVIGGTPGDNNGGGNNDKNKPGDDWDANGAKDAAFNDAF